MTVGDSDLDQLRQLWRSAKWQSICQYEASGLEDKAAANYHLMKAGAYLQLGHHKLAREHLSMAMERHASRENVAKVLLSCMETCLGRIALLHDDLEMARRHFEAAMQLTGHPQRGLDNALSTRLASEMTQLGMLQDSGKALRGQITHLKRDRSEIDLEHQVEVLSSEIATLEAALLAHSASMSANEQISYSQLGQDRWVLQRLGNKRGGYFVEFGATDGILLSNTYLLETRYDWTGIVAEPNPQYASHLRLNRHCTVGYDCISGRSGDIVDFVLAKEYGGMADYAGNDKHLGRRDAYAKLGNVMQVETISLQDFLEKYDAPREIDYLSIDTEGSELSILQNFPLQDWDIRCITIEHNHGPNKNPIRRLLSNFGYRWQEAQWDDWFYLP